MTKKEKSADARRGAGVIVLEPGSKRPRRKKPAPPRTVAPGMAPGVAPVAAGNLALAASVRPVPAATPRRWFSEKNGYIGFRLWDIVYIFSLAAQGLDPEDAIEWGARYFSGALSEEHGRAVLEALAPGEAEQVEATKLHVEIIEAFRRTIRQGLRELLGKPAMEPEHVDKATAYRIQHLLEALYEENGWLLPTIPLTLHRMLRRSHLLDY